MGDEEKKPPPRRSSGAGVAVFDLTHARHDPGHVLAPGLFRSLGAGDRKKLKLDVTYIHGKERLEFGGKEPLGVDDMRVLQGLVAMAGPEGLMLRDGEGESAGGKQLALDLFTPPHEILAAGKKPDTLVVRDSLRRLAREVGMAESGQSLRIIRKSVERLFGVTIFVQSGKTRFATRLLSSYASDEGTGDLFVAVNPRVAEAILGDRQHVRIDLDEVRNLKTDPARLIHQRLCGWIDCAKSGKASLDTLSEYVWPDTGATEGAIRKRRVKVRAAMKELEDLGWSVVEDRKGICTITRPRLIKS
jgi:hypothetical protein